MTTDTRQPATAIPSAIFAAILAAGVALQIRGFQLGNLFVPDLWEPRGIGRFHHFLCLFLLFAVPILVLVPWCFTGVALSLAAVATAWAAGPVALLSVVYFLLSACALGSLILRRPQDQSLAGQTLAAIVGVAVYIFLMTFLARLPVNYPLVWVVLLAIPIACDWTAVRQRLAACTDSIRRAELGTWGERAAAALLVFALATHWLMALKPEISADGLAMHLAVPANLATHHQLTFEPARFIWSVMPMGADWIYSIVYQLGGEAASRLINFAMLLAIEAMLYGVARRWLSRAAALLVTALFATTPMVQLVSGSLFVENLQCALILALLAAIWQLGETGDRRWLFAAAILAGGACSTKFGAIVLVGCALPFAAWETRRHWRSLSGRPAVTCVLALILFAVAAAPTYAIAYEKTHNPVYPFLSQKFHSTLLNVEIATQYHEPLNPKTLYDLTFHTENYYEARNGSFGFQYLLLAPLALAGLLVIRDRPAVSAAIIGVGAAVLIMRSESNVRYIYASLPMVTIAFAAVAGWTASHRRVLYRALMVCTAAWACMNLYFLPASGWYHRDFYSPYTFARHGSDRYLEQTAPERLVIRRYNQLHPGSALLLTADTNIADVRGEVYENSWHQWNVAIAIQNAAQLPDLKRLFDQWKVQYFISPDRRTGIKVQPPLLGDFVEYCTVPEYELGGYTLSHLAGECRGETSHPHAGRVDTRPLTPVAAGTYDDFDDALHFNGDWEQNRTFNGPYRHTITFTDDEAAAVEFAFTGQTVTWLFSRAPNRGFAQITIDGADRGSVDLYSPTTEWQASRKFAVVPGRHVIRIRVLGKKSPASTGQFVDVDGFVVE